jgi:alpha-beta hydrolase superfamily lysophospholipase
MSMLYQVEAPGNWGSMVDTSVVRTGSEMLAMSDGCKLFLRSWVTEGKQVLLIVHGLGAHSGWFIDMGNALSALGLTVYIVDQRGFGRSEGLPGHIDRFGQYVEDLAALLRELRTRHMAEGMRFFLLGHSMGGIFISYLAAAHPELCDGVLYLNPWVQDQTKVSATFLVQVFVGGLARSRKLWRTPGGPGGMTTNFEAITMLEADPYWRRDLTATFLVQIFLMRQQILKMASRITRPALVMQAERDQSVVASASRKLYETLGSKDKTWQVYPNYAHDTQLEADRTALDRDIVEWIQRHSL